MQTTKHLWNWCPHERAGEDRGRAARTFSPIRTLRPFVVFVGVVMAAASGADDVRLSRWTIDGGGEMRCTGGGFELSGTIGQPDAGTMSGLGFELAGGFWFPLAAGDCNTDGVVGLVDFNSFHPCVSGPDASLDPRCACYDLDRDNDVDLADIAELQQTFDGG